MHEVNSPTTYSGYLYNLLTGKFLASALKLYCMPDLVSSSTHDVVVFSVCLQATEVLQSIV